MKDCRFLLPFVDELRKLYPDHKIEWVRDNTNTEYEKINIDDKTFIYTEIGHTLDELGKDKVVSASIIVEFQNLSTVSEYKGFTVDDPYSIALEKNVRLALFSDHKCLREIFKFILTDSPELVRKQMDNLIRLDHISRDF
jgi:hypothetical protein